MAKELWNKFEEKYIPQISALLTNIESLEEEIIHIEIEYKNPDQQYIPVFWRYKHEIMCYLQYCNGSLGNDSLITRLCLQSILGYSLIAKDPSLTESEQDICTIEIEYKFYVFLNCIYNIKEKLERLFSISKKNPNLTNSILIDSAKRDVLNLFKNIYPLIEKFCIARGHIVHNIYQINYNIEKNCINVSYSIFDLSEDNILEKSSSRISFDINELIYVVEVIQKLRKQVILILSDFSNIDVDKLRDKFLNKANNSYIVSI